MLTKAMFLPLCLIICVAGCGKEVTQSAVNNAAFDVQTLPVLTPKAGGELILVPAGSFAMGQRDGRADEKPHEVSVGSFYIDKYLITQELYEKVMGVNPSKRKFAANPVERTQWTDAVRFCNKCSEVDGLTPCYNVTSWVCNFAADGYRLPTEAEWEYACRAGSNARYCFGDDEAELSQYAWFKPHSQGKPQPVGQKLPNRWGLFDMHGNVWEWCNDYYSEGYYQESPAENPKGPSAGTKRVLRGGAWDCTADKCRAACRSSEFPVYSDACFGADSYSFRRARNASGNVQNTAVLAKAPVKQPPALEKNAVRQTADTNVAKGAGALDVPALKGTIVFVSDRSGVLKIWSMHAGGKNARQLTHDANPDADPRFAPDGKRILYTTLRGGFPEVWLMNRDGTNPRVVTKGSQGNWSPDGRAIVFIRDNQTFIRDVLTGTEQRVTPDKWERCGVPAWSPDGKQLAVASRHLGNIGIFMLDVHGRELGQLKAEEPCCTPQWSKDGSKILCQTVQGHICQLDRDGKNWEQLTSGADVQHDARYSPDGSMIIFCRAPAPEGPWQVCVKKIDSDDADFVPLTKEGSNLLPDWHPDE